MICDVRFLTLLCNKIKHLLRAICIPGGDIGRKKIVRMHNSQWKYL